MTLQSNFSFSKVASWLALASSLVSPTHSLAQGRVTDMTQAEIHDRIVELCADPKVRNTLVWSDEICEISTDGGKTWTALHMVGAIGLIATLGGLVGTWLWIREREKTRKEQKKQDRLAQIEWLKYSNLDLYNAHLQVQQILFRYFPELEQSSFYSSDDNRVIINFTYEKTPIQVWVRSADNCSVFKDGVWYQNDGTWWKNQTSMLVPLDQLEKILSSIKNREEKPPVFPHDDSSVDDTSTSLHDGLWNRGDESHSYSASALDHIVDVDPIAEAGVYFAYGRFIQANEILLAAYDENQEPDRDRYIDSGFWEYDDKLSKSTNADARQGFIEFIRGIISRIGEDEFLAKYQKHIDDLNSKYEQIWGSPIMLTEYTTQFNHKVIENWDDEVLWTLSQEIVTSIGNWWDQLNSEAMKLLTQDYEDMKHVPWVIEWTLWFEGIVAYMITPLNNLWCTYDSATWDITLWGYDMVAWQELFWKTEVVRVETILWDELSYGASLLKKVIIKPEEQEIHVFSMVGSEVRSKLEIKLLTEINLSKPPEGHYVLTYEVRKMSQSDFSQASVPEKYSVTILPESY
jgi:hypothetical protein